MKTETFKGSIESAYGRTLPTKLSFNGSFEAFESLDEVKSYDNGSELPSDKDIVDFVNAKRKANARQKSMNEALTAAGIEKPTLEDPQVQLATIVKALRASGRSEEEAITLAETTLGVKYQR
jgi:hypothetical protein